MSTPKKQVTPKLIWNKRPNNVGEYAYYKLGIIFRNKGSFSYKTTYNKSYKANSLADAKKQIDRYTEAYLKESIVVKIIQPKKKK